MAAGSPVYPPEPGGEDRDLRVLISLEEQYDDLSRQQISACLSILAVNAKRPDIHYKLGRVYQTRGEYNKAVVHYQRVISLDPDHLWAHYRLGESFIHQGWNYDKAIETLQKVLTLASAQGPERFSLDHTYALLGLADYYQEDYQAAQMNLRQAVNINPALWGAYHWLGVTQYLLARYPEAQISLTRALSMKEGYRDFYETEPGYYPTYTHYYLGLLAAQEGRLYDAEEHMRQALTFDLHNTAVIQNLAGIYKQDGRTAQAIGLYLQLIDIYPQDSQMLADLADLYDQEGNTDEAIARMEEAVMSSRQSYYRGYVKTYQKQLIALYQKAGNRQAVNRLLKEVYRFAYWHGLVFLGFLVALYGLIMVLGWRMIQRLPSEEGEERFRAYHGFRQQVKGIFILGCAVGGASIYLLGGEYFNQAWGLPEFVMPAVGVLMVIITVVAASARVDRKVRKTSAGLIRILFFYIKAIIFLLPVIGIVAILCWAPLFGRNLWEFLGLFGMLTAVIYLYPTLAVWLMKKIYRAVPLAQHRGELHHQLQTLAQTLRVPLQSMFTLDTTGMRFANAFAVGVFPRDYNIMFTTSLIKRFTPEEIFAIFLHELGHLKHHHVRRKMHLLAQVSILTLAATRAVPGYHGSLTLIFWVIYLWLGEKKAKRFEYEADAFVVQHAEDPLIFIQALEKLYAEAYLPRAWNPSNHLGLANRIKALQDLIARKAEAGKT
jgi:tetratricopeptide (TPR) repeat protein/Zn-dependent protease with chaperone function